MKTLFVLAALAIAVAGSSAQTDSTKKSTYQPVERYDPKRDAAKDIHDAVVEAGRSGKRILLDVGGDWCIWCKRLDSLFQANREIADFLHQNYIVVKINFSKENENEKVLSNYPAIKGYPHLFVLESDGALLRSQDTGALESGKRHDPARVMAFLTKWAPGVSGKSAP